MDFSSSQSALSSSPALNSSSLSTLVQPAMHVLSTAVLLGAAVFQNVLGWSGSKGRETAVKRSVDDFIDSESPIALTQLLCNIGPDGCNAADTDAGVVIASPSTDDPDYFYTWTRDSALVFKSVVDRFTQSYDAGLQHHIEQYIAAQAQLQGVSNPSGSLPDGSGLGEPKFEVNLTQFTGDWGRPQRDGPALRAIAMIAYAKWLINNDYKPTVSDVIWPILRNDLDYVAQYWNHTGFDLWEEVDGSSFFTVANQHRALVEGSSLASILGQPCDSYAAIAPQVLCFLQHFWMPSSGYLDANINSNEERTGKDANTLLASIHLFDPSLGCDAATFQPCSDKALSNHKAVVDSFRFYNINKDIPAGSAVAVGRYAEDVYYEGNPWYLATFAAAEQLYDALYVWNEAGSITVTDVSLPFFKELVPDVQVGTYSSGQPVFSTLIGAVSAYADEFVNVAAKYTPSDGSLAEQFSKDDGTPLSAKDLTWSYASFLTAAARRSGIIPPSWANQEANSLPEACSATSVAGSYSSATATSFPASQTPRSGLPIATPTTCACVTVTEVAVTFKELAKTGFGQTIKIVGNVDALGNWDTNNAVVLDASEYTSENPLWQANVSLKAGHVIEYKYINVNGDGSVTWERDPNHVYTVPKSCTTSAIKSDSWQY